METRDMEDQGLALMAHGSDGDGSMSAPMDPFAVQVLSGAFDEPDPESIFALAGDDEDIAAALAEAGIN